LLVLGGVILEARENAAGSPQTNAQAIVATVANPIRLGTTIRAARMQASYPLASLCAV